MENLPQPQKSFWDRPEGKTGMFFSILMGAGILYGLFVLLPFIVTLMANAVTAVALGVVLFVMIYTLMNDKFQNLAGYLFRSAMRAMTGFVVQLNPIGIIKDYIEDLKKNLAAMDKQITNLKGQMRSLLNLINQNKASMQDNLSLADQAKKKGMDAQVALKTRKAGRLQASNMNLTQLYTKMEMMYRYLDKMHENAAILVEDMSDEVTVKEREQAAIMAGHNAFKSALKIIKGDPDKVAMFNQANQVLADDMGMKVGEMERAMEVTKSFMDSIDLENGVFEEKGIAMLDDLLKNQQSSLLGTSQPQLMAAAEDPHDVLDLNAPRKAPVMSNKYKELI